MANYYIYLISSLPMLHFQERPPFSFEGFIDKCRTLICDEELKILQSSSISGDYDLDVAQPALENWRRFDTALRNELVRIRAARKHIDPLRYLREDTGLEPYLTHLAMSAHREASVIEAEKALDYQRWCVLDEISRGHYFDLDFLVCYAHKLLILQRWEAVRPADKAGALEGVLAES